MHNGGKMEQGTSELLFPQFLFAHEVKCKCPERTKRIVENFWLQ